MFLSGRLKTVLFPALLLCAAELSQAAGFGTVVAIGGHASDIALDVTRSALYIANFTANRIDVLSLTDLAIHTSINVAPQPGALAISPNGQFLLTAHYGNWTPSDPTRNLITVIHLPTFAQQTFVMGDAPLGVAFLQNGVALIVTETSFVLFDPVQGTMQTVTTFTALSSLALPVQAPAFPAQILSAAVTASGDGYSVWGIGSAGSGSQVVFRYDQPTNSVQAVTVQSSPALLPRVSVNTKGSQAMVGYALFNSSFNGGLVAAQYPDPVASSTLTGSAIDTTSGIIYAQIPDATQPTGPPFASGVSPAAGSSTPLPTLCIMDADNLTLRERVGMPEDIVGRALLSADLKTLYAISDSGVMALPVGMLNQYPRVAASQEDLLVQADFCNRGTITQSLTISDPGGGATDFGIVVSQAGVTVSPSSGVTPATINVVVDPTVFQAQNGTTAVTLNIRSKTAINVPRSVRVLVNNPSPDQRGTIIDVPGRLTDLLADPVRNRIYILRQDANSLLVYNGSTYALLATLRTAATPVRMAFSSDMETLIVAHENAQTLYLFDLNALKQIGSIPLPIGHYARSVAVSNASALAVARNGPAVSLTGGNSAWIGAASGPSVVDAFDPVAGTASVLPSLGIWTNAVTPDATLTAAPNGASVLLADSTGAVMLYNASAGTFVLSRHDFTTLGGALAASSFSNYVVGSNILDASLVPIASFASSTGASSGFAFVGQGGFRTAGSSSTGPGVIQDVITVQNASAQAFRVVEAPVMPAAGLAFTRTLAPLTAGSSVISLSASGFTVLPWSFDVAITPPLISSVANAADGGAPAAAGGLISIFGQQLSPINQATAQIPLPTAIARSCVTVNGALAPMFFVSDRQINAQLPNNVSGNATLSIYTPGGISNNYYLTVYATAPSIFRSGTAGPLTGLATVVRWNNGQLVTPTNPIHPGDYIEIYLTGMGATTPLVPAGQAGPFSPLSVATILPSLSLGGYPLNLLYAGLAPGLVGVDQIDAQIPSGVPQGMSVPLTIAQGGQSTSVDVRVVN